MMTFDDFKNYLAENIKSYLPTEFSDYDVKATRVDKVDYSYDGFVVKPIGETGVPRPVINATSLYSDYTEGKTLDGCMKSAAEICTMTPSLSFNPKDCHSFDGCKNKIFPRIINSNSNADYLADKPHTVIADLSVIYCVIVSKNSDGIGCFTVTDDILDMWGIDVDELHSTALANLSETEIAFHTLESVYLNLMFGNPIPDHSIEEWCANKSNCSVPMFVLTNAEKMFGAAMVLNDSVMKKITDNLGSVYVLPSSVHEVMVVPTSHFKEDNPAEYLSEMVKGINAEDVPPKDRLSDNVYIYTNGGLHLADTETTT